MFISIHDSVHNLTLAVVNRRYKIRENIINIVIVVK